MKTKTEYLEKILKDVLSMLDVEADISIEYNPDDSLLKVDIDGDDLGNLIGYHGTTISALTGILRMALDKEFDEKDYIRLDVSGYLDSREIKIKNLVKRAAENVENTGVSYKLSPMKAMDRRLVHTEVSEQYPNLVSYSVGEGLSRRVVISNSDLD